MASNYGVEMRWDARTPMRDEVQFSSDIYLPKAEGPFPTVLVRNPYSNNNEDLIERGRRER